MDLANELELVLAEFEARGVPYALAGGLALAVHGVVRATEDIDVLVEPNRLDSAIAIAHHLGFTVESTLNFTSGLQIRRLGKVADEDLLVLDLMVVDASSSTAFERRERVGFGDLQISVVSRHDLIALKLAAGRDQDLADVRRLTELDG